MSENPSEQQRSFEEVPKVEVSVVNSNENAVPQQRTEETNMTQNSETRTNILSATLEAEVLNLLTQVHEVNDDELRQKNTELLGYLAKLIELLKEKTNECTKLEKQNLALTQQSTSLKEVVAIVKDLLNIRNMEVKHLQEDMNSMQEKINNEREKQTMIKEKMEHVAKLNQSLKEEYKKQYGNFQNVCTMYEEKVSILVAENKRLQNLHNNTSVQDDNNITDQVNERLNNINISIKEYTTFDDTSNENVEK